MITTFGYTNYRGEAGVRLANPTRLWFGSNEWHPEEQWLLDAFDLEKKADRVFALRDVELLPGEDRVSILVEAEALPGEPIEVFVVRHRVESGEVPERLAAAIRLWAHSPLGEAEREKTRLEYGPHVQTVFPLESALVVPHALLHLFGIVSVQTSETEPELSILKVPASVDLAEPYFPD